MKTSKYLKTIAFCTLLLAAALPGKAQVFPNTYINIDWQMGVPLGDDFADKASGWGMNFEGGYFVTPAITVGPFISYQTNLQSIDRQTLDLGDGSSLTTNQKHALFQLPFGVTGRYNWLTDSVFQPYAGLKRSACRSSRVPTIGWDSTWRSITATPPTAATCWFTRSTTSTTSASASASPSDVFRKTLSRKDPLP